MNEHADKSPEPYRAPDAAAASAAPPGAAVWPLRIWPAIALLAVLWGLKSLPLILPNMNMALFMASMMGPILCCLLVVLWWVFLSRASWKERILGAVGLVVIGGATSFFADKSVQGFGIALYAMPIGITAFAATLILLRQRLRIDRTWLALGAALLGFGFWTLIRMDGVWGDFHATRNWRWVPSTEQRFLETMDERTAANALSDEPLGEVQWPAFRGPQRDGRQPGVVLLEDWEASPPKIVWRVPVGPGWSSFSVAGRRLFTQEQRGENEATVCLDAQTGAVLWAHEYPSRFWEPVGGAGPRATPTLDQGRLFALGAQGNLHRLDPVSGEVVWEADLAQDAQRQPPQWGFSSSPLIYQEQVIVHAGGLEDLGLLAYDAETGKLLWTAPSGDHSYSSPQLIQHQGQAALLMVTNEGLAVHDPKDGAVLAEHSWDVGDGYRVLQPLLIDEDNILISSGMGMGSRRLALSGGENQLSLADVWTSKSLSPDFNDSVAHQGYLYGFDRNIFSCLRLSDGERMWKKGRYGNGQVLLLPDADQLLVLTEKGEVVLLRATQTCWKNWRTFKPLKESPGITPCWSATSCTFVTPKRPPAWRWESAKPASPSRQANQRNQRNQPNQVNPELTPSGRTQMNDLAESTFVLTGGDRLPAVGMGLWKIDLESAPTLVAKAVEIGYRHFDSACDYGNEAEVGRGLAQAVQRGLCRREELWITSKLWNTYHRREHVRLAAERSLRDLHTDYLDLYLIHFPIAQKFVPLETRYPPGWFFDPDAATPAMEPDQVPLAETWEAMEQLVQAGLVRNIGVCNFGCALLRDLMSYARIPPAVLQVESHPLLAQPKLLRFCQEQGIAYTAFSPLGSLSYESLGMAKREDSLLDHRVIRAIAREIDRSPAQVLLRWGVQRGAAVIPKTSQERRLQENLDLFRFALTDDHMQAINALDEGRRFNDPGVFCEAAFHRFFPIYE